MFLQLRECFATHQLRNHWLKAPRILDQKIFSPIIGRSLIVMTVKIFCQKDRPTTEKNTFTFKKARSIQKHANTSNTMENDHLLNYLRF